MVKPLILEIAQDSISFCREESCGKCVPCRIGGKRMAEIMERVNAGQGKKKDLEILEKLGDYMKLTSDCGLGQSTANTVLSAIRNFRGEIESYIDTSSGVPGQK